jgi:hypothetical protein
MCVLIFSTTFVWNISHSKKNWARCDFKKRVSVFTYSTRYSCPILMKFEYSKKIFEKYWNTKINENPSSGSRVVPWGQTDGRATDMLQLIVAFRKFSNVLKNGLFMIMLELMLDQFIIAFNQYNVMLLQ